MTILRHHFRQERGALVGWGVALLAFTLLATVVFAAIAPTLGQQMQQVFQRVPAQMRHFLFRGGTIQIGTVGGWVASLVFSGLPTLLVALWLATAVAGVVAAEVDSGTLEFLLALPVRRTRLLAERWGSLLLQLLLLYAGIWVGVAGGAALIGRGLSGLRLAEALGLAMLGQCALAGMLICISLAFRDQVRAALATAAGAFVFVFIPVLVPTGSAVSFLRQVTPLQDRLGGAVMLGGAFPWGRALLLVAWALAGLLAAAAIFSRQEV